MTNHVFAVKVQAASIAAVLCVALLAPGCGDSAGTGSGGGTTATTTVSTTTSASTTTTTSTTTTATTTTATTTTGVGGGGGAGGGSCNVTPTPVPGDACDAVAEAYCSAWEGCNKFVFDVYGGTKAECLLLAHATCVQNIVQPGDANTASAYEACAEGTIGLACSCPSTCSLANTGSLPNGNACMDAKQCASGDCHGRTEYVKCGTCWKVGALNDACSPGLQVDCGKDLYCNPVGNTCVARKANGAACTTKSECLGDVCYAGMCSDPLGPGAACGGTGGDSACDLFGQGLRCGPTTSVCEAYPVSQLNEACGVITMSPPDVRFCAGNLVCSASKCIARAVLGASCTLLGGPTHPENSTCLPHLHCIGGVCAAPTPLVCQ